MSPILDGVTDRQIIESTTVDNSNGWWTGVVRDRHPRTGSERVRLERHAPDSDMNRPQHKWRIRPDFWPAERNAVARFERGQGSPAPATLPLHPRLDATRYLEIRRDDHRWVAVVEVDRPKKGLCTRLYHWDASDRSRAQSWTVGEYWTRVTSTAETVLSKVR